MAIGRLLLKIIFMHSSKPPQVEWICLRWLYDDLKIVYGRNLCKSNACKMIIPLATVSSAHVNVLKRVISVTWKKAAGKHTSRQHGSFVMKIFLGESRNWRQHKVKLISLGYRIRKNCFYQFYYILTTLTPRYRSGFCFTARIAQLDKSEQFFRLALLAMPHFKWYIF